MLRSFWARVVPAVAALAALAGTSQAETPAQDPWAGYLDYAYVYSSAEAGALAARLDEYARKTGLPLERYIADAEARDRAGAPFDEVRIRRRAVASLLIYLARGEDEALWNAGRTIRALEGQLGRHENRYWIHYIHAHEALERRNDHAFVTSLLELWLDVVAPLETPYETLRALSLTESASAGFAAALPYVYENLARIILLRTQEMGLDRNLDSLGALVRMLRDGRVGAHPEVIPREASSIEYLDRIVRRLDGNESDGGSLTFTLALFEARKVHDTARGLLAQEGLSDATVAAFDRTTAAYRSAYERAHTTQGQAAVTIQALRELGEFYAARQREGSDRELDTPFNVPKAMETYDQLHDALMEESWDELGYRSRGHDALLDTLHRLWEEIQETSLNAAAYHLAQAAEGGARAPEHLRNAARIDARYLDFFERYLSPKRRVGLPDSAWFAAYEAARGYGDAYLAYPVARPTQTEIELATRRYLTALRLFPFDVALWSSVRSALERQGRVNDYLRLVRPISSLVARSRFLDGWVARGHDGAQEVDAIRKALAEDLAIMYLGFADGTGISELEQSLEELEAQREKLKADLAELRARLAGVQGGGGNPGPAAPAPGAFEDLDRETLQRRIDEALVALSRLDKQVRARTRALPLFRSVTEADGLPTALSARRDHPVHAVLRRLHDEWESRRDARR